MNKKSLFTLIFVVCFFGSIFGFVSTAGQGNGGLSFIFLGNIFLAFGIIAFISSFSQKQSNNGYTPDYKKNRILGVVVGLIGVGIIISGYIEDFGSADLKSMLSVCYNYIPVLMEILLLIIGIWCLVAGIIRWKYEKTYVTYALDAEVIQIVSRNTRVRGWTRQEYAPVWRYYFNGMYYTQRSPVFYRPSPYQIGDHDTIKINPDKPEKINSGTKPIASIKLGLLFIIISGYLLYLFITNYPAMF